MRRSLETLLCVMQLVSCIQLTRPATHRSRRTYMCTTPMGTTPDVPTTAVGVDGGDVWTGKRMAALIPSSHYVMLTCLLIST